MVGLLLLSNWDTPRWLSSRTVLSLLLGFLIVNVDLVSAGSSSKDNIFKYSNSVQSTIEEFSEHLVIKPQIHHARHKRAIRDTFVIEEGGHTPHITLSYHHHGHKVVADLHLNDNLFPEGHFLRFQNSSNGADTVQNFTKTDVDLCHYQGTIRGKPNSRVAVSTCNGGVNGVVLDETDTYFIHSQDDGSLEDDHFLFKHDDLIQNATCGFDNSHSHDANDIHHIKTSEYNRILRYKRSNAVSNIIRGPYNANKHSSFVELVIVVDQRVFKSYGESLKKVHKHCQDLANIVNALYVPLNIFVALVGVVVWNESNEIEFSSDGDVTLKNFLHYRRTKLSRSHPNDNAQLLTKESFTGGVVGKALKGPICTYEYSGGVANEHSSIVAVVATTMAHEMGHNFGMEHDTRDCKCQDKKCIMSESSTSVVPRHWSSCSIDQLNVAFSRGMNYCLRNKPTKLFESPQCGNGFVEPGEQCDCGLPQYCENSCCDPTTCMLRTNASCATGECCDLSTCRPKTAGTQCRLAEGECDLPEYCTGESEYCPIDVYKRDTDVCDNGNAFCYQGSCKSRRHQCKILWGPSGDSSDHCYSKNTDGSRHGNCGYDRINNKYMQCQHEDVFCGMLHCRHLNERLEFGMESVAVLSHSFLSYEDSIIPCRNAVVDLGLQSMDPGLTPNGAKCGDNKMCVNQKCVAIKALHAKGRGVACPEDCNGNGVCNSKGHCHCFADFGGPTCREVGYGGSEDSGPATNPNSLNGFTRAMFIFFLGVVPFISALLFVIYKWRNIPFISKKPSSVTKPTKIVIPRGPTSPSNGDLPTSSPSSTDDMNSALLKSPVDTELNNGMFGKFKGFTLRPLPNTSPTANGAAPNIAYVTPVAKSPESDPTTIAPVRMAPSAPKSRPDSVDLKETLKQNGTLKAAPALPPPNPGSHPRPIISSPVLETSTCTAKELISPLKTNTAPAAAPAPIRVAPAVPAGVLHPAPAPPVPAHADPKFAAKAKDSGTIKRITSFLKKDDTPKQVPKVKPVMDKEKLKNIEISAPIPVVCNAYSDSEQVDEDKRLVSRAQSMRSPTKKAVNVHSFGSMRQPSAANRPKSSVGAAARPKSPPPRPPPATVKSPSIVSNTSGYQTPIGSLPSNPYDDCEAVEVKDDSPPSSTDNIYSVIDETPPKRVTSDEAQDDMGLLDEIVCEFGKRNGDSIYSASTLNRKKANSEKAEPPSGGYANVPDSGDSSEGDYVKSTGSTTSNGYLRPTAVAAPVARVAPTSKLSSFKPTTEASPATKPTKATPASKAPLKKSTTTVSDTKTAPASQKPKPLTKPPLSGATKPTVGAASTRPGAASARAVVNKNISSSSKVTSAAARPAAKASNVASLQQKFESANKSGSSAASKV